MPDCHKCKWNDAGRSPGKEAACLSCVLPEGPNHHGASHVSIDAGGAQTAPEVEAAMARSRSRSGRASTGLPPQEAEMQVRVLQLLGDVLRDGSPVDLRRTVQTLDKLADLSQRELSLLFRTMSAKNVHRAAAELGISHQAAYKAVRRIVRKHPEFRWLFGSPS